MLEHIPAGRFRLPVRLIEFDRGQLVFGPVPRVDHRGWAANLQPSGVDTLVVVSDSAAGPFAPAPAPKSDHQKMPRLTGGTSRP